MISRYRNDNPRSAEDVAEAIEYELHQVDDSYPVTPGTQTYAYVSSFSATIAQQQEQSLNDLYDAAFVADATGEELTKRADELGVTRRDAVAATGVAEFTVEGGASQDRTVPSGTRITTGGDNPATFETTELAVIESGDTTETANIRCTETGPVGNVGANTIGSFIDRPPGVDDVTNPKPTGDPEYTLTDGVTKLTSGDTEESDESLRSRTLASSAIGGAGTASAAQLALENIESVISADVYTNRSASETNNVDPWHTEVRVYGGSADEIADTLYDVFPIATLKTLQGGANGTYEEASIDGGDLYGTLTIPLTRPTEVTLEITVDLVHDANYGGTKAVKNAIVDYVGGTTTDSRNVIGLRQGRDVIVNEVENRAEDVTGVDAVTSSLLDTDGDGTSNTTTDADGVEVIAISDSDVARVDAANITVNETAR